EKRLIRLHQYIEDRIANSENIVFRWSHLLVLLRQLRLREKSAPSAVVWSAAAYHDQACASKRRCHRSLMIRSFLTVSTGTLASLLTGFVRDSMLAALLGAGPLADAFLLAFQLVNVIRRLLTEGALNAALVPAWLRVRDGEGATMAAAFAGRVLGTVSATLIAAAALLPMFIAPLMTR